MNVAISTQVDSNAHAGVLVQRLVQEGHPPVCVLSMAPTDMARRLRGLLGRTYREGQARWQQRNGSAPRSDRLLDAYARRHGIDSAKAADLPAVCAQLGVAFERAPKLTAPEAAQAMRAHSVDLLLNCGGGLFRKELLESIRVGVLNPHMGRLPPYRGYNVMEWMVLSGEMPCSTLHFIDPGIDTGDILLHRPIQREELPPDVDLAGIRAHMGAIHLELLLEGVKGLAAGTLVRQPQRLDEGRQHFAMSPKLRQLAEARWRRGGLRGCESIDSSI